MQGTLRTAFLSIRVLRITLDDVIFTYDNCENSARNLVVYPRSGRETDGAAIRSATTEMYASYSSGNQEVLNRFAGTNFEAAKVQLEDDCILPALHDLIDHNAPQPCSEVFRQTSGKSSPGTASAVGRAVI